MSEQLCLWSLLGLTQKYSSHFKEDRRLLTLEGIYKWPWPRAQIQVTFHAMIRHDNSFMELLGQQNKGSHKPKWYSNTLVEVSRR